MCILFNTNKLLNASFYCQQLILPFTVFHNSIVSDKKILSNIAISLKMIITVFEITFHKHPR